MKSKLIWWGSTLVITLLTIGYTQESEATGATNNAGAEFSATNNPNGVWSYGWSTALGSAFNLGVGFVLDGLDGWGGFITGDGNPSVLHNGTSSTIMLHGILPVPPGALVVHPGPNNQKQIVRWTAPAAGGYTVAATFTRIHFGGTDVHVLHNGSSIFDGAVNQTTNVASFSATLVSVNVGDTIDFAVGFGSDGVFFGDSTTLTAVITPLDAVTTCVQLPAGAVSWWPADGSSQDTLDGNHGTLQGGAGFAPGHVGQSFSFDGVDDNVLVPDAPNLNSVHLTVEAWLYRTGQASVMHILGKRSGCSFGSGIRYQMVLVPGQGLVFSGAAGGGVATGFDLPLMRWTHVAATADGTAFSFYINGKLAAKGGDGILGPAGPYELRIGTSGECVPFSGLIDEVAIFDRALSPCEIKAIFDAGTGGRCKGDIDSDGVADYHDNCPSTPNPIQQNADTDTTGDACDCAPLDGGAFGSPEISGLQVGVDGVKSQMQWCSARYSSGANTSYDVVRGATAEFPVGSGTSEICLGSALPEQAAADPAVPVPGAGHWYLVRSRNACGPGTYGFQSDGTERVSIACP